MLDPYTNEDAEQNPNTDFTAHPNKPLQIAIDTIKPTCFIHWTVTTIPLVHGKGIVTNIPFEERLADVTDYWADYWLLSTDEGKTFPYLAYTQTMLMNMIVKGHKFSFPHVTGNVVTRE